MLGTASPSQSSPVDKRDEASPEFTLPVEDSSCPIKGMYRLLNLIMEQGNSGLGNRLFVVVYIKLTSYLQLTKS